MGRARPRNDREITKEGCRVATFDGLGRARLGCEHWLERCDNEAERGMVKVVLDQVTELGRIVERVGDQRPSEVAPQVTAMLQERWAPKGVGPLAAGTARP